MKTVHGLPRDLTLSHFTPDVVTLMLGLMSSGSSRRRDARKKLARMGPVVLPQVFEMLKSKHPQIKWEAAQVLKLMASERAVPKLLLLLKDEEHDIRWIAAEALIKVGRPSLIPLLETMVKESSEPNFRSGAHHVLIKVLGKEEQERHKKLLFALDNYQESGDAIPLLSVNLITELGKQIIEE